MGTPRDPGGLEATGGRSSPGPTCGKRWTKVLTLRTWLGAQRVEGGGHLPSLHLLGPQEQERSVTPPPTQRPGLPSSRSNPADDTAAPGEGERPPQPALPLPGPQVLAEAGSLHRPCGDSIELCLGHYGL